MAIDPLAVAGLLASILDRLYIAYAIGGAVASTLLGEPRATHDLDVVAAVGPATIEPLLAALEDSGFYVPRSAALNAVAAKRSFSVVHQDTSMKVDIFVAGRTPLDEEELQRRQPVTVSADASRTLYVAAPEDLVLQKLLWYREGGNVSDRQWCDVLGVLKVQQHRLDRVLMRRWAARLGIDDLLERAFMEAGNRVD
jgi:hypothetical protein